MNEEIASALDTDPRQFDLSASVVKTEMSYKGLHARWHA